MQPAVVIASNADNGSAYIAVAPDEISYNGQRYERISSAQQLGQVGVGTTDLIFEYKVKELQTPQDKQDTENSEHNLTPIDHEKQPQTQPQPQPQTQTQVQSSERQKESIQSEKTLIKPGSQLPATGEQNSQLAYLGFAFLTGFAGLVGYKKKQD